MDLLGLPGYAITPAPDPHATDPVRLRALVSALSLVTPTGEPPEPGHHGYARFVGPYGAIELMCDEVVALTTAATTFRRYLDPLTTADGPTWRITLARVRSLDAAASAFVATPLVPVDHGVQGHHHTSATLGDSWWVPGQQTVIHHGAGDRWVGARYVGTAAARFWAPRLVSRVLLAQYHHDLAPAIPVDQGQNVAPRASGATSTP